MNKKKFFFVVLGILFIFSAAFVKAEETKMIATGYIFDNDLIIQVQTSANDKMTKPNYLNTIFIYDNNFAKNFDFNAFTKFGIGHYKLIVPLHEVTTLKKVYVETSVLNEVHRKLFLVDTNYAIKAQVIVSQTDFPFLDSAKDSLQQPYNTFFQQLQYYSFFLEKKVFPELDLKYWQVLLLAGITGIVLWKV